MVSTPGCKAARSVQLRPLSGSSRTVVAFTVALISEEVTWTAGASVVTWTVGDTVLTCKGKSKVFCAPTFMVIPVFTSVFKHAALILTWHSPGSGFTAG